MSEELKLAMAKAEYQSVCQALDDRNWKYNKDDDKLLISFGVNGEDLPLDILIYVDVQRSLVRVLSKLPFKMNEDKRMEGAVAVCAANYGMVDGSFDYDLSDGSILYRVAACFNDSCISKNLYQYLISCACVTVDKYNDQFLALNKGMISLSDFIKNA